VGKALRATLFLALVSISSFCTGVLLGKLDQLFPPTPRYFELVCNLNGEGSGFVRFGLLGFILSLLLLSILGIVAMISKIHRKLRSHAA